MKFMKNTFPFRMLKCESKPKFRWPTENGLRPNSPQVTIIGKYIFWLVFSGLETPPPPPPSTRVMECFTCSLLLVNYFIPSFACENINLSLTCASNRNKNRSKKKTTRPQNKHFTQPWLCMSRGCSPKKRKNEPKWAASLRHCLPSKHTSHVSLSSARERERERWQSNNDNVRIFAFRVASDAINYKAQSWILANIFLNFSTYHSISLVIYVAILDMRSYSSPTQIAKYIFLSAAREKKAFSVYALAAKGWQRQYKRRRELRKFSRLRCANVRSVSLSASIFIQFNFLW